MAGDLDVADSNTHPLVIGGICHAILTALAAVPARRGVQGHQDLLRATTDEAIERGAFGAPSLFVGDPLFRGNDRLPLLEDYLARLA